VADYIGHSIGKLSHVEVDYPDEMIRDEDRGVLRLRVLDLSVLAAVRAHVFKPKGWTNLTRERCEEFFDDDANFAL